MPYDVGFTPPTTIYTEGVEIVIDIIFVFDIIMSFFTAVIDTNARLITGAAAAGPTLAAAVSAAVRPQRFWS